MANKKRLIDANALIEKAEWYEDYDGCTGEYVCKKHIDIEEVENASTVDAVEVVRCKDCEFSVWNDDYNEFECVRSAEFNDETGQWYGFTELVEEYHFCSYGERKDNEKL